MFWKTLFLCVLVVMHGIHGFTQGNTGTDPIKLAGSLFNLKDASEKQIKPIVGLLGAPIAAFSEATHEVVKRATDDEKSGDSDSLLETIRKAKEKEVKSIFGFFGKQFESVSKALNALGGSSSDKE